LDDSQIKLRYFTANLIGLAMIGSVFMYAGVVVLLPRLLAPFSGFAALNPAQVQTLKYLFVALALGIFFLIKIIQRVIGADSVEKLFQAAIVTFALSEAVGVLGLVLFLLAGNPVDFYLFMFLSLFYFWFFYPKYKEWEAQLLGQPGHEADQASDL
jgi:F0F1-type ATP synthase membrane subunit c/vacuolar-type H+-ATPase subunit K